MKLVTIILAAGKGTRMKSDLPKVLHPILDVPMINYVVDTAKALNSDQIIVVVGHQHDKVINTLNQYYDGLDYAIQSPQKGTAHAVLQTTKMISNEIDKHVLILSGDVPLINKSTLRDMILFHYDNNVDATVMTTIEKDPTGYGRIIRDGNNMIKHIVEEKDIGNNDKIRETKEVNCGIYMFRSNELFDKLPYVDNDNEQKEYYLPKVLEIFLQQGLRVQAYENTDMGETHGVNTIEQLHKIEEFLSKVI